MEADDLELGTLGNDFIVKGLAAQSRSVIASRKEAMLKKRQIFYLDQDASGGPKIYEDCIVRIFSPFVFPIFSNDTLS